MQTAKYALARGTDVIVLHEGRFDAVDRKKMSARKVSEKKAPLITVFTRLHQQNSRNFQSLNLHYSSPGRIATLTARRFREFGDVSPICPALDGQFLRYSTLLRPGPA